MRTLIALAVAALSSPSTGQAAQMALTRPELCLISDVVVVAEVTSGETRWAAGTTGGIERIRWAHAVEIIQGDRADTLEVVLPGGTMGDLTQWVEDVPELLTNATYLLFLAEVDGALQVVGGDAGAVRIAARRGQRGEPLADALATVEVCRAQ